VVKYTSFYKLKTKDKKESEILFTSFLTNSSSQTKKIGRLLAEFLKSFPAKKAMVLGLKGDLGGGKTTFLQGFALGLGIKEKILSPTFIVMRKLDIDGPRFKNFYHLDCYRIRKSKELLVLGLKKIMSSAKNIVAIEWADRIKDVLPKNCIMLEFEFVDKNKRKITLMTGKNGK